MTREIGPREKALREMREASIERTQAKLAEVEAAEKDVRRKERVALKSADTGAKLVERIKVAAKKRGRPRKQPQRKGK